MKVFQVAVLVLVALVADTYSFWFFSRNMETTATADGMDVDPTCVELGQGGSCEFYDCFEQRLPCGRDFYMQRYGNHYCNRFMRFIDTFTEEGQEFLLNVQQCVTSGLVEQYEREYVNCHELEHFAFSLAGRCYVDNGFCDVIGDNTQQFLQAFEINDLFRSGSTKLWRELLGLAHHCGGRALANFMRVSSARLSPLVHLFARFRGGDEDMEDK